MVQKYMIRKIRRFSGLGSFFWLLYQYIPDSNTFRLDGRYASLGQLLCALGCSELENWHFTSQTKSPGGHVFITSYSYTKTVGSCDVKVDVDVMEKSEINWNLAEDDEQILCNLSPAGLHRILRLLHDNRVVLQNDLGDPQKTIDAALVVPLLDEVNFIDCLSAKLNRKMRQWRDSHPDDMYALPHPGDLTSANLRRIK